jgi:hypothetical protein
MRYAGGPKVGRVDSVLLGERKPLKFIGIRIGISFTEPNSIAILKGKIGWGGRIRTFTIHINSVVSYRLDHAPAGFAADLRPEQTK